MARRESYPLSGTALRWRKIRMARLYFVMALILSLVLTIHQLNFIKERQVQANEEEKIQLHEINQKKGFFYDSKTSSSENGQNRQESRISGDQVHELNCAPFGGPEDRAAVQEMVYWRDIPSDATYQSPFFKSNNQERNEEDDKIYYLTFEPDLAGWNNVRMGMETILALAIVTGRTLVLPPEQPIHLLRNKQEQQKNHFSFQDFFPLQQMAREHKGLNIITTQEFLEREALSGNLKNKETDEVEFPPRNNRTDWNGHNVKPLRSWLRNVAYTPTWDPHKCIFAVPASNKPSDADSLQSLLDTLIEEGDFETRKTIKHPIPVNSSTYRRLKDNLNGRKKFCRYSSKMQQQRVIHLKSTLSKERYLTHFYDFLFFQDWRDDLWMKRFMRDHVRYVDEIQCAAARIVQALRQKAQQITEGQSNEFDSFHIRRGDFTRQYKATAIGATEIYDNVKEILPGDNGKTLVFIATNERNKEFFDPLREHYQLYFLDDFQHLLQGVNANFFGMIDQLVASKGRFFFGCYVSTFTNYIIRLRGYHSQKSLAPGWEKGLLPDTFYYVFKDKLKVMHKYSPINEASFLREFPTSWRNLDHGLSETM